MPERRQLNQLLKVGAATAILVTAVTSHARTITFSGYSWEVRPAGTGGPGPNHWDPDNVSVDTNGYLHLRLNCREGTWYCAEIYSQKRLGFGRYEFSIYGPLDRLDRNIVLGLFNYPTRDLGPDGTHELDIEFARWGSPAAPIGNYTVWPATNSVKHQSTSFPFTLDAAYSTHNFDWSPTHVLFQSVQGLNPDKTRPFATWLFQPLNPATHISQKPMPVHLNLWCFKGHPPVDGHELEIVVPAFKFTPLQ